jgi:hypothetical protein
MQPNPYEPPALPGRPSPPRKLSIGATIVRIGATLAAIGAVVFVCCFLSFTFLMDNENPAPFWMQLSVLVAVALVPVGMTIAVLGGAIWVWGIVRRRI